MNRGISCTTHHFLILRLDYDVLQIETQIKNMR